LLALVVALIAAAPAVALTPRVKDDAGFFPAKAVDQANEVIREIKEHYHKDLMIETFKTPPGEHAEKVRHMDAAERQRFFANLARERAREEGINGIYVLICREPSHLQIEVGNETSRRAFTIEDRKQLRDMLVKRFKAHEYDQGLVEGVEYVRDTLKANLREGTHGGAGGPITPEGPGGQGPGFGLGGWLFGLVCVGLVVLLLVIGLVRLLGSLAGGSRAGGYAPGGYGAGGGYPAPGYGYGGGGGGFLSSLFGGLFGAAAGNWVYDRVFRGGNSGYGGGYPSGPAGASPDQSDRPDTDYSGAGGDFDASAPSTPDSDGGGDFGGSELGSGDFYGGGGGDFGGGGDSGGGGGGDTGGGGDF
jgi:uncharacterized protein